MAAPADPTSRRGTTAPLRAAIPWGVTLAIALVYLGAAKLGLTMAFVAEQVTAVWPPTGIALAALLLFGLRAWPGIALGAFVANATTNAPLGTALGIAIGNTLEAVIGAWLLGRLVRFDLALRRMRDVLALVVLAALGSTTVSATIGVASLCLGGVQPLAAYGPLWWVWWVGDATGDLIMAPLLLTWATTRRGHRHARRLLEAGALASALVVATLAVFLGLFTSDGTTDPLVYTVFPFIIWATLRFGQVGTATVTFVAAGVAIWGTVNGLGPFAKETVNESLILLQLFMAVIAVTGLLLGAAIAESRRAERRAAAQYVTASTLAESRTIEEAMPRLLEGICRNLDWDLGVLWAVDPDKDELRCIELWNAPTRPAPRFESDSRARRFAPGVGLPGRVWATAKPLWLADVVDDANFPRPAAAEREGLRGAFGIPIVVGGEVDGVMEFFSREVRPLDDDLLEAMAAIGHQVGQFIGRARVEAAGLASEALKGAILTSALDCVITIDEADRVIEWNPAAERTFHYSRPEVLGRKMVELIVPPELRERHERGLEHYLRTGEGPVLGRRIEITAMRRDGSLFPVELAITPIRLGARQVFTAYLRDITERRRATDALRESEARLQAILDNTPACIFVKDLHGRYIIANRSLIALFGWPGPDHVLGRTDHELHGGPMADAYVTHDRLVLETGRPLEFEEVAERPEGAARTFLLLKFPLRDHDGNVHAVCGIATDITARKEAEESLKEADRRKNEFLAMLAHELRNPLASVSSAATLLKVSDSDEQRAWAADVVERQVRHLAHLIDDLLDVSRITRGMIGLKKERLELGAILESAVESVRPIIEERKHELAVSIPRGELWLDADPTRLEQILVNLLTNAAKYTESGGQIWLGAEHEGGEVAIRVRDTGMGIPPELLPHVFELFAQGDRSLARSEGGLGIGLTLAKRLAELHGGSVSALSEGPGKGSTFLVRLPAAEGARPARATGRGAATEGRRQAARILVVDDNVDTARGLSRLLKLIGHEVRTAHDGPSAIEAAREFFPEFILLDIGLPGMDGYQVAARLRQEACGNDAVLVAITGYGQEKDHRRSKEAGFDHHLVKPVDYNVLVSLIK